MGSAAWAFHADSFMARRFDNQSAHSFTSRSLMTNRLENSVYEELTDSLARAKKQSSTVLSEGQSATVSPAIDCEGISANFTAEQEDFDPLAGKHHRNKTNSPKRQSMIFTRTWLR